MDKRFYANIENKCVSTLMTILVSFLELEAEIPVGISFDGRLLVRNDEDSARSTLAHSFV